VQDIICFQEFPQDKIQESMMVLGRTPYGWRFVPSFTFRSRVYGLLTLFRKDTLHLVSTSIATFGIHPMERSIMKSSVPRSALTTKFAYQKRVIRVTNVHFVSLALNRVRYTQIESVATKLAKMPGASLIIGDFNISSIVGKKKMIRLLGQYGYVTVKAKLATHRLAGIRHQYDYVFNKGCSIGNIMTVRIRLSDHYPLFAQCRLS